MKLTPLDLYMGLQRLGVPNQLCMSLFLVVIAAKAELDSTKPVTAVTNSIDEAIQQAQVSGNTEAANNLEIIKQDFIAANLGANHETIH